MQQVRGRMVSGGIVAPDPIHGRADRLSSANAAGLDSAFVQNEPSPDLGGILNLNPAIRPHQGPLVTNLTAAFRIKRSRLQDDVNLVPFHDFVGQPFTFEEGLDDAFRFKGLIPEKFRRRNALHQRGEDRLFSFHAEGGRLASPITLGFQRPLKPVKIRYQSLLPGGFFDQIQREAVGVI